MSTVVVFSWGNVAKARNCLLTYATPDTDSVDEWLSRSLPLWIDDLFAGNDQDLCSCLTANAGGKALLSSDKLTPTLADAHMLTARHEFQWDANHVFSSFRPTNLLTEFFSKRIVHATIQERVPHKVKHSAT